MNLSTLFNSVDQATAFVQAQQHTLQRRNEDLRTLGHSKALHALAESLGYSNWHAMKHALDELAGASNQSNESESSEQTKMALSILADIETLSARYDALDDIDDFDAVQDLHDEFAEEGFLTSYRSDLTITVNVKIGSGAEIRLEVEPQSMDVVGAKIAISGNEGKILKEVPSYQLDALGRKFSDDIEAALSSLINP